MPIIKKKKINKKSKNKKRKNPVIPENSIVEFFEVQRPRTIPKNPIEAFDLGTVLGVLRGLELCNEILNDDIELFIFQKFKKPLSKLKSEEIIGPNELRNTDLAFEKGVLIGLATANEKYCRMPKKQLQEFIKIARFKLNSLSHYL